MKNHLLSVAVAAGLLASGSASAITNVESNASIPFSFSNPGARSLAMGGAFIGAADDATAAYSNPAGLTRLGLEQQFSLEIRNTDAKPQYPSGGSFNTGPFDLSGVNYRHASSENDDVSFIGWVLPRDTWSIALYRQQTVNLDLDYSTDPIFFNGEFDGTFVRPYDANTDLELVTWGASFATNINENLSWGVGLNYQQFDLDSSVLRFDDTRSITANQQTQRGDDDDFGYSLGVLYKGSDAFSIGMSYRSETQFNYRFQNLVFDAFGDGEDVLFANGRTSFKTPDVFSIGMSWRANDNLTINFDVNRVGYSNLTEDVEDAFFAGGEFEEFGDPQVVRSLRIKNAIEPRFGVEYLIDSVANPVSLRFGSWREQRHTLEFANNPDSPSFDDAVAAAAGGVLFSAGDDEMHYSAGFGIAFPHFQIDFAYDHADIQDVFSLSGVYRF